MCDKACRLQRFAAAAGIFLALPRLTDREKSACWHQRPLHKTWHYYIRRYSSTVEAKGEAEMAKVSDLSLTLMQAFLQEISSALAEKIIHLPPSHDTLEAS